MADQAFADGLYDGIENPWMEPETYHGLNERVSRSQLLHLFRSPAAFQYWKQHPSPPPTDAMVRGDAIHAGILEPARFREEYLLEPVWGPTRVRSSKTATEEERRTTASNRERKANWEAKHANTTKKVVPSSVGLGVTEAILKVREHPDLSSIFESGGIVEPTALFTEEVKGIEIAQRIRPDLSNYDDDGPILIDVKTMPRSDPRSFWRTVTKDRLHIQAAMYCHGMEMATGVKHNRFRWVACEVEPPYDCGLYVCDEESLEIGRQEYRWLLEDLASCRASGDWPDHCLTPHVGGLETWYRDAFNNKAQERQRRQ